MKRGLRYFPAPRRGRRRLGLVGLGVLAALTLVWQQQATVATFLDAEHAKASFTAATLAAIDPTLSPSFSSIDVSWKAAKGTWAPAQYAVDWSAAAAGTNPRSLYSGASTSATHSLGSGSPSSYGLAFTEVAAGATHACGIATGTVYCWGTSASGALGLAATSEARVPTAVTGGDLSGLVVTDVTVGTDFSCAVAAGRGYCWGLGANGQLGTGSRSSSGTPKQVSGLVGITSLSAGGAHACAVSAGKAYCWGLGTSGQLGNGDNSQKESPQVVRTDGVLAGRVVSGIAAGGSHSCAIADGQAFCWGLASSGQLGNNSTSSVSLPVAVDASGALMGRAVAQLSAGSSHTCATADDKAFCWGLGTSGQLGNSAAASSIVPVAVATSTMSGAVAAISAGTAHSCAVSADTAYCWGAGASYGLGNNSTANANAPVVTGGTLAGRAVTEISAGASFGCAASAGKPASCWGLGDKYQLGDDATASNAVPGDVSLNGLACPNRSVRLSNSTCSLLEGTAYYYRLAHSIGNWNAAASNWAKATTKTRSGVNPSIDSRTGTSIALKWSAAQETGEAYPEYTLQRSTSSDGSNPVTLAVTGERSFNDAGGVPPTRKFTDVSAGDSHTCGIIGDDLYCWGLNSNGQLGLGDSNPRTVPTRVTGLDGLTVTAVSAGANHTCAVATAKVYCWGQGTSGQLGNGSSNTQYAPVLVSNQAGVTAIAVSAGGSHTCAIASAAAYCWGSNSNGQLGNNSTHSSNLPVAVSTASDLGTKTVTAIAAGGAHTCATASNSREYCWGANSYGQLGSRYVWFNFLVQLSDQRDRPTPAAVDTGSGDLGTKTVTTVTAGTSHTCVIADPAKAYCWGRNNTGQLGTGSYANSDYAKAASTGTMSGVVTALSAGPAHSCAIAVGTLYCWGLNASSQLGNRTIANSSSPVAVSEAGALKSSTPTAVAAGALHSCAVADGESYCWGNGDNGRLGNRATSASSYPVSSHADALCATGSTALGDGTCSLAPGTIYYYRVTYTLDGNTSATGPLQNLTTAG